MERRDFLAKAATVGAAVALAACGDDDDKGKKTGKSAEAPAVVGSQPQVKWRLASSFPKTLDIFNVATKFTDTLRTLTGGKFDIQVHAAGELVPAMEVLDATQQGSVQCCHTFSLFFLSKNKAFLLGTGTPFGMSVRAYNAWIYHGGGQALMDEFYNDYNVVSFLAGNSTSQMGGWFRKEIKGLADLNGLKMRTSGLSVDILGKLGVKAVQLPAQDILPALERGDVDAAKWQTPYEDEKLGFHKVAKNYYYPGWWEPSSAAVFFVNKGEWAKLPKEYQDAFRTAAVEANTMNIAHFDNKNPEALSRLIQNGVTVRPYPDEILDAAYQATKQILGDEAGKNPAFKKIYDEYEKYRLSMIAWFSLSETRLQLYAETHK